MRKSYLILTLLATAAVGVQAKPAAEPVRPVPAETRQEGRAPGDRGPGPAFERSETKEEFLKRAAARFDEIDANHDGIVTAQERKAHFEAMRAERPARKGPPDGAERPLGDHPDHPRPDRNPAPR